MQETMNFSRILGGILNYFFFFWGICKKGMHPVTPSAPLVPWVLACHPIAQRSIHSFHLYEISWILGWVGKRKKNEVKNNIEKKESGKNIDGWGGDPLFPLV